MRDGANELYDRACDLVLAARELRTAAASGRSEAVAATLGCVGAALADLAATCRLFGEEDAFARAAAAVDDAVNAAEEAREAAAGPCAGSTSASSTCLPHRSGPARRDPTRRVR